MNHELVYPEFQPDLPGEEVTYTRRFFGDGWVEGLLFLFTLGVGWFIWLAIVAPRGRTPAKQLLGVYIHDYATGERSTAGTVWFREVVCKHGIETVIGLLLVALLESWDAWNASALYGLIGGAWVFAEGRRALWDHMAGTVVRYHPSRYQQP
jgi:hypothetical protein